MREEVVTVVEIADVVLVDAVAEVVVLGGNGSSVAGALALYVVEAGSGGAQNRAVLIVGEL